MFTSVDSDKSAVASTAGGTSNAGSDIAGQLDSSTKVCYDPLLSYMDILQCKSVGYFCICKLFHLVLIL